MKKTIINTPIKPTSPITILLIAVFALSFLSSCATLKKNDCVEGNWSGIGFNDAAAGLKSASQFGAHSKACSKYKITPNVALYKSGYSKGLLQFCTVISTAQTKKILRGLLEYYPTEIPKRLFGRVGYSIYRIIRGACGPKA